MKNINLFPFERNHYYYGKLLSVNDFEMEQRYMNDKRRMINRLLFGCGVVAGMHVLAVDDSSVSVERGLALDYAGREIVIDQPVIRRLSLLDGYDICQDIDKDLGYLYLCLEYDEEETAAVYNAAGRSADGSDTDYNKIRESYRLFLTDREPEDAFLSYLDFCRDTRTVYRGNGIRIRQSLRRFVRSGEEVRVTVEVENMGQQGLFAFSYDLALKGMSWEGKTNLKVSFNEALFEKADRYAFSYSLSVHPAADTWGVLEMEEGSFRLSVEQLPLSVTAGLKQRVRITAGSEIRRMQRSYYEESMETYLQGNHQTAIYLAKISLVRAGESYVIQGIRNMPFGQYVPGPGLTAAIQETSLWKMAACPGGRVEKRKESGAEAGLRYAQGETVIVLGDKVIRGRRFFSEEIVHGLGLGPATIVLSLVEEGGREVYGSSEVFEETEPVVEMAARLNRETGSFVIGVRAVSESMRSSIRIHWTAWQDTKEQEAEKKERRIFIKPGVLRVRPRASVQLKAICSDRRDENLRWFTTGQGGFVDTNGMYTAPGTAGVFEVTAQSEADPKIRASVFVIVQEAEEQGGTAGDNTDL